MTKTKETEKGKTRSLNQMIPKILMKVKFKNKPQNPLVVNTAEKVFELSKLLFDPDTIEWTEAFYMLSLNAANNAIGYFQISQGGTAFSIVDPKVVFTVALNAGAHSLIFLHNHPSGVLSPSMEDIGITKSLVAAGKLLDIKVLDHVIVSSTGFYSMAQNGLI